MLTNREHARRDEERQAERPPREAASAPALERVLALQRSAGNQAVGRMLLREVVPKDEAEQKRFAVLMGRWKKLKNPTLTWTEAVKTANTLDELDKLLTHEQGLEAAPQLQGKKKKKAQPMSLGDFKASVPEKKAWSTGSQTGLEVVKSAKKIEGPVFKPVTLESLLTDAEAEAEAPATNVPIVKLINGGKKAKNDRFAVHMRAHDQIFEETVYLPMTIYVKDGQVDGAFLVYLHYHPRPASNNWLHVKRTKAATPEHRVDLGWWFVDRSLMEAAHGAWQDQFDKDRKVKPPWQ